MAKRKKKRATRRKTSRPIVVNFPARRNPGKRRKMPARTRSGRFVSRRRRNPIGAAATIVNPSPRRRRRKRRSNPSMPVLVRKFRDVVKPKVLFPAMAGAGLGVVGIAVSNKYLGPRVSPRVQGAIEAGVGLLGIPVLNKLYKGSGYWFAGFMLGSGISRWLLPVLPFGLRSGAAVAEDMGDVQYIGELDPSGMHSDGGLEAVVVDDQGNPVVVDGLGQLPPFAPPGGAPPMLMAKLEKQGLAWLLRVASPGQIRRLMMLPPRRRQAAIAALRAEYDKRKAPAAMGPPRFAQHPAVMAHPHRRGRGRPGRGQILRAARRITRSPRGVRGMGELGLA